MCEIKKHFSSFLKGFQLLKNVLDLCAPLRQQELDHVVLCVTEAVTILNQFWVKID